MGSRVESSLNKEKGRTCLVFGVWCLVFGVWCLVDSSSNRLIFSAGTLGRSCWHSSVIPATGKAEESDGGRLGALGSVFLCRSVART